MCLEICFTVLGGQFIEAGADSEKIRFGIFQKYLAESIRRKGELGMKYSNEDEK